ncbi:MAG: hypothetical protein GIW94_12370 [Candidatus Eremiobacteraeota bacterium]|nr:hypothetical protein [Candidatus Eremiobacteraeota bacterium]
MRAVALWAAASLLVGCVGHGPSKNGNSSTTLNANASNAPVEGTATSAALSDALTIPPAPQPSLAASSDSLLASQPGPSYSSILGPSATDDGLDRPADTGKAVARTFGAAPDLLSSEGAPTAAVNAYPPTVSAARALDANIPASEYDLAELAKTLPNDPLELYRAVADQIAVDGYDGVMRGPLVTWMSRAGGPADKVTLLAWMFVTKGIPYQFVRGTLSSDERTRIAQAAATVPKARTGLDPKVVAYTNALIKDGGTFADWVRGLLKQKSIALGNASAPGERLSARHYWIQIERGGKLLDLDPTLPGTTEGTHLGTGDPAFKATAILPRDEFHVLQVRVVAAYDDTTTKTLLEHTDTVPDLAQTPIRVIFAPSGKGADLSNPGLATAFDGALAVGGTNGGSAHLDLRVTAPALRSITLEVRRKDADGKTITVARRTLTDANDSIEDRPYRLAGLTTVLVVPGRGVNAFTMHEQVRALAQFAQDVADANAGKPPPAHLWYPIRIADYVMRDDTVADALGVGTGIRLFRDRPNVIMQHTSFARGSGNASTQINVFDIADNGMGGMSTTSDAVVAANMVRGYADTQIEHDVAEAPSPNGTIPLFATAGTHAAATVMTHASASDASEPLRAGLDQTFAAGQVAIAPPAPTVLAGRPSFGWWAIDPSNGNSIGRMSGGAGQDMAEYTVSTRPRKR